MRYSGLWALLACFVALCVTGCGGGGSGASSGVTNNRIAGVWTGTSARTNVTGQDSTLRIEFFQNGTTITGTASATGVGGSGTGTVNGTLIGNHLTVTIAQDGTTNSATQPVTEATFGGAGGSAPGTIYSTQQLIDVNRPVTVTLDDVPVSYQLVTTTGLPYTNHFTIPVTTTAIQIIKVTYTPYIPAPLPGSTSTFTGTVSGNSITGIFTVPANTTPTGVAGGKFTLTKSNNVTTPNLTGAGLADGWIGTYTIAGKAYLLAIKFRQNQDSLFFTGPTGPVDNSSPTTTITGSGAVVGNNVTLVFTNNGTTISLSGPVVIDTANPILDTITGTLMTSTTGGGTFSLHPYDNADGSIR